MALWWQTPIIHIPNSKKKAIHLQNHHEAQTTVLVTLSYTNSSGINNEISSAFIIPEKSIALKKVLGTDKTSTVYMGEMQRIQDLLTYVIKQHQTTSIQIFMDNQAVSQAVKDLSKYSAT